MSDNEILVFVVIGIVLFFALLFAFGWLRGEISNVERKARDAEREVSDLSNRYWELWHRHTTLLNHFGLVEQDEPKRTALVKRKKK